MSNSNELEHDLLKVRELKGKLARLKGAIIGYVNTAEGGVGVRQLREDKNIMKKDCVTLSKYAWDSKRDGSLAAPELETPCKVISLLMRYDLGGFSFARWVNMDMARDYVGMNKWEILHEITSSALLDNLTQKERHAVRWAHRHCEKLLSTTYAYLT